MRSIRLRTQFAPNTVADTWSTPLAAPANIAGAGVLAVNDHVVVFGGYGTGSAALTNTYVYDPTSDSWTTGPSVMPAGARVVCCRCNQ
jgi:N-acetylneuraminic acid mutarotase